MPKISLIKHRIHQEQLRLLESQKNANFGDGGGFGSEPLSLVSRKKDNKEGADRDIFSEENRLSPPCRETSSSPSSSIFSSVVQAAQNLSVNQRSSPGSPPPVVPLFLQRSFAKESDPTAVAQQPIPAPTPVRRFFSIGG